MWNVNERELEFHKAGTIPFFFIKLQEGDIGFCVALAISHVRVGRGGLKSLNSRKKGRESCPYSKNISRLCFASVLIENLIKGADSFI